MFGDPPTVLWGCLHSTSCASNKQVQTYIYIYTYVHLFNRSPFQKRGAPTDMVDCFIVSAFWTSIPTIMDVAGRLFRKGRLSFIFQNCWICWILSFHDCWLCKVELSLRIRQTKNASQQEPKQSWAFESEGRFIFGTQVPLPTQRDLNPCTTPAAGPGA